MDVRCERCQSEYEVEDAHVSDLGTEVQCSDCGHLFVVKRPASPARLVKASPSLDGEDAGTWVIETIAGSSLRLRDLTTLHKWIIERRVGRQDRLSRGGDPWQRLGDLADLAPFFDIVESAERALDVSAPPPVALPGPAELPAPLAVPALKPPQTLPPSPDRSSFEPYVDKRPGHRVIVPLATPAHASRPASLYSSDADKTVILRVNAPRDRGVLKLLITVLVAAVVAYAGILWQHHRLHPAVISSAGTAESPLASQAAEVVPPAPAAENAEPAEDSNEGGGTPTHGPLVEPIADSGPAEKVPLLGGAAKHGALVKPVAGRKGKSPAVAHAQGKQASSAKPNAPQAPAAQGYVALNHRQPARAVALFKRALASNPNNGTALFGLAEAYRIGNQLPSALLAYRRYVDLLPSGPDAGSARYQIRLLENKKR
jgi:predicted Zn finger-like uncharacterized protein